MLCGTEGFQEKHLHPCWCWEGSLWQGPWHWGALERWWPLMTHEKIFGLLVQRQSLLCQLRSTSISRQGWGWGGLEASFCLHTTRHWNIHKQRDRTRNKRQRHKQRDRRWSEQVLRVSLVSSAPVRDNFLHPPNLPSPTIALSICQVFHSVTFGRSVLVRQDIKLWVWKLQPLWDEAKISTETFSETKSLDTGFMANVSRHCFGNHHQPQFQILAGSTQPPASAC